MSKSTYFTGQPVYSQVIKLLDKAKIQQISLETLGSERYVKRLTGWKHLIIMLFGVLKHFDSLRDEELAEIYKRRWAIETLYKQLKQNFPLHFFYGESVNAIQIQTWVVLIANLLCTVLSRMIKRHVSFSQIVTMLRLTLMYYTNFIAFMEDPQKDECAIWAERAKSPPLEPSLFD